MRLRERLGHWLLKATRDHLVVHVRQGKAGKWRWFAYLDDEPLCQSPILGFLSITTARNDARRVLGAAYDLRITVMPYDPNEGE